MIFKNPFGSSKTACIPEEFCCAWWKMAFGIVLEIVAAYATWTTAAKTVMAYRIQALFDNIDETVTEG